MSDHAPLTFADIRSRLAGLHGRTYWRSLEELAETPEFEGYLHREFPANASEFTDPVGRRQFLRLMGASLALAGVSACTRQPEEKIIPYVRQPEEVVPGRPLFFATAMPLGGFAMPLLAENHMGRPTKLEGNPEHPASLGATDVHGQASVLSLYDPDRSRGVIERGEFRTWGAAVNALTAVMNVQRAIKGQTLRLLTEPITSPSLTDQIQTLLAALPAAKWHQWDPIYGAFQQGAPSQSAVYHFDKADVVVSLDADFLGFGPSALRYTKDFSARRRVESPESQLNRLYVVEPVPTITGAKADHRLALKSSDVHAFAAALAAGVGVAGGSGSAPAGSTDWVSALAADLHGHHGRSVIVAGDRQPPAVHALARAMNEALGNAGTTVTYGAPVLASPIDGGASLTELVGEMNAGKVDVLLILGTSNPVFTAPADLNFTAALDKVGTRVHVGLYNDETAERCHWHIPEAHYLESWGDARSFDGTVTFMQPLIAPLYDGRQVIEVLATLNNQAGQTPADLVKGYWTRAFEGKTQPAWTLHDNDGKAFASAAIFWRKALHDGFIAGTTGTTGTTGSAGTSGTRASAPVVPASPVVPVAPVVPAGSGIEVVFRPDPMVLDGRFSNNGWLQEMPKPLSKVTWDAVAYISPRHAEKLGIPATRAGSAAQDVIEITVQGRKVKAPVWVMPGVHDDVVAVHFGYGRRKAGRIGTNVGFDTFGLRSSKALWFEGGGQVTKTSETYDVASTQNHFMMEDRHPIRVVDSEAYRKNPKAVEQIGMPPGEPPRKIHTLFPVPAGQGDVREYLGDKWGMSIDLNACTGCHVCITACVAENNIAIVGKEQVMRQREMHWLRVDTYFEGDLDAPTTYNQPVPCQQCEAAPCELVCPVAATSHNDEGLNDMVYNRCVGTRYCSNNCPYKVRRFNFLLYADYTTQELFAQRNPDVTVRSRGVMEKCTYCVQRISHARIDAKTEGRAIRDGEVKTACQQACPADAIVFGNLNDAGSQVVKRVKQDRNYSLLEELGTKPRTTYLAAVRNPNPALEKKKPS